MTDKRKERREREIKEEKGIRRVGGGGVCAACQRGTAAWVAGDCLF